MGHLYVANAISLSFSFRNYVCLRFFGKRKLLKKLLPYLRVLRFDCVTWNCYFCCLSWNKWIHLTSPVQHVHVYQMGVWTVKLLITRSGMGTISSFFSLGLLKEMCFVQGDGFGFEKNSITVEWEGMNIATEIWYAQALVSLNGTLYQPAISIKWAYLIWVCVCVERETEALIYIAKRWVWLWLLF